MIKTESCWYCGEKSERPLCSFCVTHSVARNHIKKLIAAGVKTAPDIKKVREIAEYEHRRKIAIAAGRGYQFFR